MGHVGFAKEGPEFALEVMPGVEEVRARFSGVLGLSPSERGVGEQGNGEVDFLVVGAVCTGVGVEVEFAGEQECSEFAFVPSSEGLRTCDFHARFGASLGVAKEGLEESQEVCAMALLDVRVVGSDELEELYGGRSEAIEFRGHFRSLFRSLLRGRNRSLMNRVLGRVMWGMSGSLRRIRSVDMAGVEGVELGFLVGATGGERAGELLQMLFHY